MKNISFIINTSNNTLEYVKLLLRSLKDNLKGKEHEILIFVDSDNEGTVEYLRSIKKDFYDLKIITHSVSPCVGYSRNSNLLVELAKHEIISYLQSDMVISKDYDVDILQDLEDNCILSATRIEPPLHGHSELTITQNFGLKPSEFQYEEFIKFSNSAKSNRPFANWFFAPYTFYKKVWQNLGGYDTLFRRSREDSDLVQRLLKSGVKLKQTYNAVVYHFSCVTSRGPNWFDNTDQESVKRNEIQKMADSVELRRFIRKWGNFSHHEILEKYDIDLVLKNVNENQIKSIVNIEPYFSRVWVDKELAIPEIMNIVDSEHVFANFLLKFSQDNWKDYSKFYNQVNYKEIYRVGTPTDWNVKIELDLAHPNYLLQNLNQLTQIIKDAEPGEYLIGEDDQPSQAVVNIKSLKATSSETKVTNPPFDMSLLTIE